MQTLRAPLCSRRRPKWTTAFLILCLAAVESALAASGYDDPRTAEGWAFALIRQGKTADFDVRCGATSALDPRNDGDDNLAAWAQSCRSLSPGFLVDILTKSPWRDQLPIAGVRIAGARMVGDLTLKNAALNRELVIERSRIEGQVVLDGARADGAVSFRKSRVTKLFTAFQFEGQQWLALDGATLDDELSLSYAKIEGYLTLSGAKIEKAIEADSLHVGQHLFIENKAELKELRLERSNIAGDLDMRNGSTFGRFVAPFLRVGGSVCLRDANFLEPINLSSSSIGGDLELQGGSLSGLDLRAASIAGELQFGGKKERGRPTTFGSEATLNLSNARIGSLESLPPDWPAPGHLILNGLTFARLPDSREGVDQWDAWFRRDASFTPTPYFQLAAAFAAAGDSDSADDARYAGKRREQEGQKGFTWLWSAFLRYVAGFGVGLYPFRVIYWILGVSALGGLYLWTGVELRRERGHGLAWCCGATLARLLPFIEINKEFSAYFDDVDQRERLRGLPSVVFSAISVLGWFLAAILIAAVSGLTGKS